MKLIDAYTYPESEELLWRVLFEREKHQSISHKRMPTFKEHVRFVKSRPYPVWYLIDCGDQVGCVYLTERREIGIGILKKYRGNGYGRAAVLELLRLHPGPVLANINPANVSSLKMFEELGFVMRQHTYALD